jgi:hypothetical protein
VYLEHRWILFDATQLAPLSDFARIATGKDAAETAFATLFGTVRMLSYRPDVTLLPTIPTSPANIGVPRANSPSSMQTAEPRAERPPRESMAANDR